MKYRVKIYFNGIHWDDSYANNKAEAEYFKSYMEDKTQSIWNRMNESALVEFIKEYNIKDEESIKITTKIIEVE